MLKVFKYELGLGLTKLKMPYHAQLLHAEINSYVDGRVVKVNIWALVDESNEPELRMFRVVETGVAILEHPSRLQYVGTSRCSWLLVHVFEVKNT